MACYTLTELNLPEDRFTRSARAALGLPEEGPLTVEHAQAAKLALTGYSTTSKLEHLARLVRTEAEVQKGIWTVKRLNPTAVVRRVGNDVHVSVQQ